MLSKIKKMSLVFIESMYIEMEGFVGKRYIFGRATDVVDSDRVPQLLRGGFVAHFLCRVGRVWVEWRVPL